MRASFAALMVGMVGATLSVSACTPRGAPHTGVTPSGETAYFGPTFDDTLNQARARIDARLDLAAVVPTPKDAGGGYTHEQHKNNAFVVRES